MKERAPAWLVWLGVLVAVAATARLGLWQLDRAAQKTAIERSLAERAQMPTLAGDQLARSAGALAPQLHRRITVTGRWLSRHTMYLDNRPLNGQAGFVVVTPLLLGAGDAVLVQRGWAPRDPADRTHVPAAEVPAGEVRIEARIAEWPSRRFELSAVEDGPIRQNLDAAWLAREAGVSLRPLSLLQLSDLGERDGLVREWSVPAQDVWKHQGYALQWFALSALIASLTLWYRLIRPRREQRS
jgi:surfeit locus 1 family protein